MTYKCKINVKNRLKCLQIVRQVTGKTPSESKEFLDKEFMLENYTCPANYQKELWERELKDYGNLEVLESFEDEWDVEDRENEAYYELWKMRISEAEAWYDTLTDQQKQYIEWLTPGPACG